MYPLTSVYAYVRVPQRDTIRTPLSFVVKVLSKTVDRDSFSERDRSFCVVGLKVTLHLE